MIRMGWRNALTLFQIVVIFALLPASLTSPAFTPTALETSKPAEIPLSISHSPAPLINPAEDDVQSTHPGTDLLNQSYPPKKVTCLTIGSRGDVQPYIALCQRLNDLGHSCTIATHEKFRKFVTDNGVHFKPICGDPEELIKFCMNYGVLSLSFWTKGYKFFKPWLRQLMETSWRACQGSDILIENPSAIVGVHIAQSLNIPYFRSFSMPWTKTAAHPHSLFAKWGSWGSFYNKMTYVAFDRMIWMALRRPLNRLRKSTLGLEPTTLSELSLSQVPFLYYFSPSLVPRATDWEQSNKITGFWFMDSTKSQEPHEELQKIIASQKKKIVYIGFGSIVVPNPEEMTRNIIEAVEESNVFAIISGGWTAEHAKVAGTGQTAVYSMKDDIAKRPDSMLYLDSVAHDWLFPKISAAFHHGGAGTTAASLRAGIPTLIKPFFADQYLWAERVEKLGVGVHVKSLSKVDIRDAILEATTNENQKLKADGIGKKIRAEDGVNNAINIIFENLKSAQELIQQTRKPILHLTATSLAKKNKYFMLPFREFSLREELKTVRSLLNYSEKKKEVSYSNKAKADGPVH